MSLIANKSPQQGGIYIAAVSIAGVPVIAGSPQDES